MAEEHDKLRRCLKMGTHDGFLQLPISVAEKLVAEYDDKICVRCNRRLTELYADWCQDPGMLTADETKRLMAAFTRLDELDEDRG